MLSPLQARRDRIAWCLYAQANAALLARHGGSTTSQTQWYIRRSLHFAGTRIFQQQANLLRSSVCLLERQQSRNMFLPRVAEYGTFIYILSVTRHMLFHSKHYIAAT